MINKETNMIKAYGNKVRDDNCEHLLHYRLSGNDYRQNLIIKSYDIKSEQAECRNVQSSCDENDIAKNSEAPSKK